MLQQHTRSLLVLVSLALTALLCVACGGDGDDGAADTAGATDVILFPWDTASNPGPDATGDDTGPVTPKDTASGTEDVQPADVPLVDATTDDVVPADVAPDVPEDVPVDTYVFVDPAPECRDLTRPNETFDIVPRGSGRSNAAVAFDGRALWVVWNERASGGSSGFAVWAARVACDGSLLVDPFQVHAPGRRTDFDPDIAVGDDRVYIAWGAETGDDPNLVAYYRTFRVDGVPIMDEERAYQPWQGGAPVAEGAWQIRVAALPNRQFALAAALGVNKAQRFQAVVQRFRADGEPVTAAAGGPEETISAGFRPQGTQLNPALAASDDGTLHVAWTGSADFADEHVRHAQIAPAATSATPFPPADAVEDLLSAGAALGAAPGPNAPVFLALHTMDDAHDIVLTDGGRFDGAGPQLWMGDDAKYDHSPAIAAAPGGGLLAWMTLRGGVTNDVRALRFTYNGNNFTEVGGERLLNASEPFGDDRDAYSLSPPAVAHLGGYLFFVLWAEGENPDFHLRGRFLQY